MANGSPCLAIIVPCFNEEDGLRKSIESLSLCLESLKTSRIIHSGSFICLIDDGSSDNTWNIINEFSLTTSCIKGIKLSGNFGHQNALLAGLFESKNLADAFLTIDADLQDDISVIPVMIQKLSEGNEIIYGVRSRRNKDSFFKKITALGFYRLMKTLGVNIIYNHADFRLITKKVLSELEKFSEVNLFLRGIFPLMGFRHCQVFYERNERTHGKTKYPFRKMLSFAFDGISSFSIKPLRLITGTGFIVFFLSIMATIYAFWGYFSGKTVPGWVSTVVPFYFLGGLQILCIGIIGEYLGRIYREVKRRPRYIVENKTGFGLGPDGNNSIQ